MNLHFDLAENQRGFRGGLVAGSLLIDGWVFSSATPEILYNLTTPGRGTTDIERAANAADYDLRARYAFTRNGKPDKDGYRKIEGPARRGHVRCPNNPTSMRQPDDPDHPTTNCQPGDGCTCSAVLTLRPTDLDGLEQFPLLGTTDWQKTYYRRVQVESGNSYLKNVLDVRRGTTRTVDTDKSRLLHTLVVCAANQLMARSYRVKHRLPDPWGSDDDAHLALTGPVEPGAPWISRAEEQDPLASARGPTRRPRRTSTYATVLRTA